MLLLSSGLANAQDELPVEAPVNPLDALLEEVRQRGDKTRTQNEQREQEFVGEQERRAEIRANTEAELQRQTERSDSHESLDGPSSC